MKKFKPVFILLILFLSIFQIYGTVEILKDHPLYEQKRFLSPIFFISNTKLQKESYKQLALLAGVLHKYPEMHLDIKGYTDSSFGDTQSIYIAQLRADKIKKILVNHGVDESRLNSTAIGNRDFVADNNTEFGRSQNNRVVFWRTD